LKLVAAVLLAAVLLGFLAISGCACVEVTPAALLVSPDVPDDVRASRLSTLRDAVDLVNRFVASPWNHSFPLLRLELRDDGFHFVDPTGSRPYKVFCSSWGDFILSIGGAAQALEGGFVVGKRKPCRSRVCDNSLFVRSDGTEREAGSVARTIVHEAAHTLHRRGTIGFGRSVLYLLEAIFLLRSRTHSAERRPRAVTEEFFLFEAAGGEPGWELEFIEAHIREGSANCEHGPYDDA
jgi:hypothetical protein